MQREVFGPVVTVTPFDDEEQVLAWANESTTGWRRPCGPATWARAHRLSARLQYGCTWVNTHFMLVSEMPHGGQKPATARTCRCTGWRITPPFVM